MAIFINGAQRKTLHIGGRRVRQLWIGGRLAFEMGGDDPTPTAQLIPYYPGQPDFTNTLALAPNATYNVFADRANGQLVVGTNSPGSNATPLIVTVDGISYTAPSWWSWWLAIRTAPHNISLNPAAPSVITTGPLNVFIGIGWG